MPTSPEFEKQYKNLNKAQKQAVDTIDGPVMVIAGPGTGKTTVLTLRIANILQKTDTPPNGILAITYTDAGVKAMRAKLQTIIGNRAHEVYIHTFHSFAASMIAEYPDHFIHLQGVGQLSDIEAESIIRTILIKPEFVSLRPLGKPDAYISGIVRSIDDAKKEALTPASVRAFAQAEKQKIEQDEDSISTRGATKGQLKADAKEQIEKCERTVLFADVYELYEEEKTKRNKIDFNDLITNLLEALHKDELLLRLIQERFLYLHVDEHQDTNDAQNYIVAMIAEFFETPNIFIVGDEKQAIYRFQGASVENFLLLRKRWPAMQVISLDINYRSHQHILDATFAMIENNYEEEESKDLRIKLSTGVNHALKPIDVITGETTYAVERYLAESLKELTAREPEATVAIITRRNRDLERIIRILEAEGIPVSSERSIDIFHHPAGILFFDLLTYFHDQSRVDALAKTAAALLWGITFEQSLTLIRSLRSEGLKEIEQHIPALQELKHRMIQDSALEFIVNLATYSGYADVVSRDPASVYVWRGIVALAESIIRENSIDSPAELIGKLLEYQQSAESKTVKVAVGTPDLPIKAMTAHGSKGLEFDYVFLPYTTEEAWIGRARGSSFVLPKKRTGDNDVADIRRLVYVALTRAKKHATVLIPLSESDGKQLTPLRFINELDPKSVKIETLPRVDQAIPISKVLSENNTDRQADKLTALAKTTLLEKGLSVTALNHFLECPSKFLYVSILKVPQAPAPAAEKGTAMHAAISAIWKERPASVDAITKILVDKTTAYINQSFLSIHEKEQVIATLTEDAPIVAKALAPHFALQGTVSTDRFVETDFVSSFEGKPVTIPLHGLLDAMIEISNGLEVYDYKTKQGMSVNEIKGLTKNSNGNYFRQLVFYKLLLEGKASTQNKHINAALVFVTPDSKGRCPIVSLPIEPADTENIKADIQKVIDSVWSGALSQARCEDETCEYCALRKMLRN